MATADAKPSTTTPLPVPEQSVSDITKSLNAEVESTLHSQSHSTSGAGSNGASKPRAAVDMTRYGTHEVTCDGCNAKPIVGIRYKCTKCRDHDICDACHDTFATKGQLLHVNKLNPLPKDPSAHAFAAFSDHKSFTPMGGVEKIQPKIATKKIGPNDPCSCGSTKKFKKCCGAAGGKLAK